VDCRDFEAWLDAGRPVSERPSAEEHARACADCGALAAADAQLEAGLATPLLSSPPDFVDRVMTRVATERRAHAPAPIETDLLLPWWIQILREPQAVLGLTLGALYAVSGPLLVPTVRHSVVMFLAEVPTLTARLGRIELSPMMLATLALPLVGAASWALYRLASAAAARLSGATS